MFKPTITLFLLAFLLVNITSCTNNPSDSSTPDGTPTASASTSDATNEASVTTPSSNSTTDQEDPYYIMHIAFEGMPEIEDFKPMMDAVMERYGMEINRENLLKVANALVVMRKESKVGVTEAEILKHVYQKGTSKITIAEQIGLSATILETTK